MPTDPSHPQLIVEDVAEGGDLVVAISGLPQRIDDVTLPVRNIRIDEIGALAGRDDPRRSEGGRQDTAFGLLERQLLILAVLDADRIAYV